jgi:beta-1,2-mannobiose phosphorylase / 1,2-beta-oligomannan phosphorylase
MPDLFRRSKHNPILIPDPDREWESKKVYNPGCVYFKNEYHLFYRAVGAGDNWRSVIGHAVSADGESFSRLAEPALIPESDDESRGLEDPRIVRIGGKFYMSYASYDGHDPKLCIAVSDDLFAWKKKGRTFEDFNFDKSGGEMVKIINGKWSREETGGRQWSKSGAIMPEKINGKFYLLFGEYRIWMAESEDLVHWIPDRQPLVSPSLSGFDESYVEMGPPPIKTEKGWLVLYHGIDKKMFYRIGFLLLDPKEPRKIICRSTEPIFGPKEKYELSGIVDILPGGFAALEKFDDDELSAFMAKAEKEGYMPKVTFCPAAVARGDELRIFYGAGDTSICTATARISDIMKLVKKNL